MKKLLREPLVHFLAIGTALFLLFHFRSSGTADAGRIVVTAGRIDALAATFERSWQRPPTHAELEYLVEEWIREEILSKEAIARGLDQDDAILRRRLRQKLEFVTEELSDASTPSDADLAAFLQSHADSFRNEPKIALRQVFVDRALHGEGTAAAAAALLAKLRVAGADAEPGELGDPLRLLADEPGARPLSAIARDFGPDFAAAVEKLQPGEWNGPIESGFGLHLVRVTAREEGRPAELSEVRDAVLREWSSARRKELADAFYRGLRARWDVVVEWPSTTAVDATR